jgi:hypothetical protein
MINPYFIEIFNHHAPTLQIPKNFKFKPICLLLTLLQDEASPSSSKYYDFVSLDERSLMILFDETCEDLF